MSEHFLSRQDSERTARVWQASDFFQLGPGSGFVPSRWGEDAGTRFVPMALPTVQRPPAAEALPAPKQELAEPQDPVPEPAAEPEPQPLPAGLFTEQDLEQARLEAYQNGLAHGQAQATRELQASQHDDTQAVRRRVDDLLASVEALRLQPEQLHEPLKRLALHLAEQLVLGELSQSPQAIERLVRRCVDELGGKPAAVRVALHPDDLALLQPWLERHNPEDGAEPVRAGPAWTLQPDPGLSPGSVRASAEDAVVNDLIEHRLDALARQILLDPQRRAAQSVFQPERLAARRADVDAVLDAQPRMSDAPRGTRFAPVIDASTPAPAPPPTEEDGA